MKAAIAVAEREDDVLDGLPGGAEPQAVLNAGNS